MILDLVAAIRMLKRQPYCDPFTTVTSHSALTTHSQDSDFGDKGFFFFVGFLQDLLYFFKSTIFHMMNGKGGCLVLNFNLIFLHLKPNNLVFLLNFFTFLRALHQSGAGSLVY